AHQTRRKRISRKVIETNSPTRSNRADGSQNSRNSNVPEILASSVLLGGSRPGALTAKQRSKPRTAAWTFCDSRRTELGKYFGPSIIPLSRRKNDDAHFVHCDFFIVLFFLKDKAPKITSAIKKSAIEPIQRDSVIVAEVLLRFSGIMWQK